MSQNQHASGVFVGARDTYLRNMKRAHLVAVMLSLAWPALVVPARAAPVPPCAGAVEPPYAAVGGQPNVAVWYAEDLRGWQAPTCTGWQQSSLDAIAASAARFHHAGTADDLLARFAAVSQYTQIPYWSPNNQEWRILVHNASALTGPDLKLKRDDFTAAELAKGEPVFLYMGGSVLNDIVYRMQVTERTPDKLTVALENVVALRVLGIPMMKEGASQFLFSFEREAGEVWRSYVLVRVGSVMNVVARPPMDQYANRAVALYRFFAGLPGRDPMLPNLLRGRQNAVR
jgi:hypothetical protein